MTPPRSPLSTKALAIRATAVASVGVLAAIGERHGVLLPPEVRGNLIELAALAIPVVWLGWQARHRRRDPLRPGRHRVARVADRSPLRVASGGENGWSGLLATCRAEGGEVASPAAGSPLDGVPLATYSPPDGEGLATYAPPSGVPLATYAPLDGVPLATCPPPDGVSLATYSPPSGGLLATPRHSPATGTPSLAIGRARVAPYVRHRVAPPSRH